jgi:chitinase
MNVIVNPTTVNFASAGDSCTTFSGTTLLDCPQIAADIITCQNTYGKTIMLSIGGATYTEGGFASTSAAQTAADNIWAMFGPQQSGSTVNRPFGTAVVDGFDFDLEASNQNFVPFAQRLRANMDAASSKKFYLSAAPQCVYPDAATNDMLNGQVSFDFISIQFYNSMSLSPTPAERGSPSSARAYMLTRVDFRLVRCEQLHPRNVHPERLQL